jgi:flagellar biosynthesis/type III secretory pathway ATPase
MNGSALGREREAADAFATIAAGQPAGFHAGCRYGKTTLLRQVQLLSLSINLLHN